MLLLAGKFLCESQKTPVKTASFKNNSFILMYKNTIIKHQS